MKRVVIPNNPMFFLQFLLIPGIFFYIGKQGSRGTTNLLELIGMEKIYFICVMYVLMCVGIFFSSLVFISDDSITGPGSGFSLFPATLSFKNAEYAFETRRLSRNAKHRCLIIKNKNSQREIVLSELYFTADFFDDIINLIRRTNGDHLSEVIKN